MRHEKKGLKEKIASVLKTSYKIHAEEMTFIPVGEESISYKVKDGSKEYFVKFNETTEDFAIISQTHQLLLELSKLSFIVPPVQTPSGQTTIEILEGLISVFPFIQGTVLDIPNEKFSKEIVHAITEIVIQIHNSTNNIKTELRRETFNTTFEAVFSHLLELAKKNPKHIYTPLILKNESKIQKLIEENTRHNEYYKQYKPHFVLTHGDVTGLNFIQTEKGLMLLDWDDSMFAPKERDVPFLVCNSHFDLNYFLEKTGGTKYDENLKEYYSLHWSLVSIVFGLRDLSTKELGEKDVENLVADIEEYLGYY